MASIEKYEQVAYKPLLEVEMPSWDKRTIEYVSNNEPKVKRKIRDIARSYATIRIHDTDDIYQELLLMLHKGKDDEFIMRGDSTVVTIDNYVSVCVKFAVQRYVTNKRVKAGKDISVINNNGDEIELISVLEDDRIEIDVKQTLKDLCEEYLGQMDNNSFNIDMYLVLYIGVSLELVGAEDRHDKLYNVLKAIEGYNKRDVLKASKEQHHILKQFAKAIEKTGNKRSVEILKKYTFGSDDIDRIIKHIKK